MTTPGCRTCSASPGTVIALHGRAAARRRGLAWLRPDAVRLRGETVRQDADRDADHHFARTTRPPVDISHPALFVPKRRRHRGGAGHGPRRWPARRPRLPRQPTKRRRRLLRPHARPAAIHAWRCASWKLSKKRADAELAYADKVLANAKTDAGQGQGRGAASRRPRPRPRNLTQRTARRRQGRHQGRRSSSSQGRRKGGRQEEG